MKKHFLKPVSGLLLACLLTSCTTKSSGPSSDEKNSGIKSALPKAVKSTPKPKPHFAKVDDYWREPIDCGPNGWPKTCAKFSGRLNEYNRFKGLAIDAAARNKSCSEVVNVAHFSKSTKNNMRFFVDCTSASGAIQRFTFTESQLASNSAVAISESEKAYTRSEAAQLCAGLIKRSATYPSTVEINFFDTGFRKYEALGNVEVSMKFKAKNAYNLELKFRATCTFQPQNPNGEIVIKERTS